ncbi:MAG: Asp-tRNA(Asn)/Glu-tRNA(Gln) amidotransferase subunit GatC [Deltaproteobacteria bacterium]|nr:Asp-tRNA(Asn)/Glu-tRNA(Gln) amidotransferase subunit GatC [Deltaproteobacteria bacterium]
MTLAKKDVSRVAELARLALTDEEAEQYTGQLTRILGYVEKLSELDTAGVEPAGAALNAQRALREDKTHDPVSNEEAVRNAPSVERGCFKVPQVIE